MKRLHRADLFGWSAFNAERNIDFHSVLWTRDGGNVVVDPLPLDAHDEAHLRELGGADTIIVTNSDHVRDAPRLAEMTGARVLGPAGERDDFPMACDGWLDDGDEICAGLRAFAMQGSKTPGELALLLEPSTLITGDLIRAHEGGKLCLIPDAKLTDKARAVESVAKLAGLTGVTAVLPGDGWPVFHDGGAVLAALLAEIAAA